MTKKVVKKCAVCGNTEFDTVKRQNADGTQRWNEIVCKQCGGNSITTDIIEVADTKTPETPLAPKTDTPPDGKEKDKKKPTEDDDKIIVGAIDYDD